MCTNFIPTSYHYRLQEHFDVDLPDGEFKAESYVGFNAPLIRKSTQGDKITYKREAISGRFGIVPHWCSPQDISKIARVTYNARSETVASKPSYRNAWKSRQFCVIPADAFYEPNYETGQAVRWRIERADGGPMAIAGIWEHWQQEGEAAIDSFSMLTINADAHPLMRRFHRPDEEKRMVVILASFMIEEWLNASLTEAVALLKQFPAENMMAHAAPRLMKSDAKKTARIKAQAKATSSTQGNLFD